jgi:UDP-N-acetylglucosamine diphosphorylase / glucose-1-phosphate thymidylyltransferase / UDP-N-acetylgalactosamine diphosphorylase / glucosamine-1-phosphate N-acetyltransferase / galactosamine-1-phosphate N-acetyltransferase
MVQAVILAAGKSTRTYPLTATLPKPLLKAANKTILEYNLDALDGFVDEVILVVGYRKKMLMDYISTIKDNYNFKINFVEQKKQLGTGHAVLILEKAIKRKFILLMGDNIYSREDVKSCLSHKYSVLVKKIKHPEQFGVVLEKKGILAGMVEKPKTFVSDLVNCAMYVFDKNIFPLLKNLKKTKRGEFELPDAVLELSKKSPVYCIKSKEWFPIGYPWDLFDADKHFREKNAMIGKKCKITGRVQNSTVGDYCTIKGTVKDSIIMDNVWIEKGSIISDSILGNNVKFSGKALSAMNINTLVKKKKTIVKRLGTIIGDNVTAIDVKISPGCKIWPNKHIKGLIRKDIE